MNEFEMPRLHVGDGWQAGAATLFPVWTEAPGPAQLAVGGQAVQVMERDGHPVVGELVLRNRGDRPALLLEGELLEGGWQHRILNTDVLLEPGQAWVAEVSCVEQGRWSGSPQHRRRTRLASGSVRRDLRSQPRVRQQQVWARVAGLESRFGATATASLAEHLDRVQSAGDPRSSTGRVSVGAGRCEVPARPLSGQRGVIVAVGGSVASLELFPTGRALAAYWQGVVDAALLDAALGAPGRTPGYLARDVAAACRDLRLQPLAPAGTGVGLAAQHGPLQARGLADPDGALLHALVIDVRHDTGAVA